MSHITVERNRRRQMNDHLKVLRTLTPCFYIKRGDQASIIGGVIEFIKELQQVVEALESKKRRKSISPSPTSPSPTTVLNHHASSSLNNNNNKQVIVGSTRCNSSVADVQVKISGSNVIVKVISHKIPGQLAKIITLFETLSFQVLHLNISSMDDTVLYQLLVQIGLECQVSLEELATQVQQTFSSASDAVTTI
ncbi:transcription factor MUTE [Senna tora]|uniref:Transcription factor MUTE n=1 Tax=Senna tora TaxID=362788 RepID=A0A834X446_9FABA|nr:transcription factor MUTE [Senna tora]